MEKVELFVCVCAAVVLTNTMVFFGSVYYVTRFIRRLAREEMDRYEKLHNIGNENLSKLLRQYSSSDRFTRGGGSA